MQMELDFVFICTEHMPLDRQEVGLMCQLYGAHGISPIVRVPSPDATSISMAIDAGAEGITVPYVETVEQVKRCVGAVKYRPIKGKLLDDVLSGRESLSDKTQRFLSEFNRNQYLIIGIESMAAVKNLDRLIDVEGVDGVFIGPHDLTVSMGIPTEYTNPAFVNAVEDIVQRSRRKRVGVGIHTDLVSMEPGFFARLRDAGMNWMLHSADITVLGNAMNNQLRQLRGLCGDEFTVSISREAGSQVTQACVDTPAQKENRQPVSI